MLSRSCGGIAGIAAIHTGAVSTASFLSCWAIPVLWPVTVVPISGLKNQRGGVGIHRKPSASKNKAKKGEKEKKERKRRAQALSSPAGDGKGS